MTQLVALAANVASQATTSLETGEGNDIITSIGVIYNEGVINTGNGNDSIIAEGTYWIWHL
jgi:hypothetical protein